MTTKQIADRLVALCRDAKWEAAQSELYAADAIGGKIVSEQFHV